MIKNKRLLILHGWGKGAVSWQEVRESMEARGIEILVPDMPGFGKEAAPREIWGVKDYKDWVIDFLQKKGWLGVDESLEKTGGQKFNLLGHSFGGGVAAVIAAECSEKIEKLILCAPGIIRRKKKSPKIVIFYTIAKIGKKIFSLPVLRNFYHLAQRIIYKLCGSKDYYLANGIMKSVFQKVSRESLEKYLDKIKISTLILWGEQDDAISIKDAYILKEKIKNSKLEIFPRIGHNLHIEMPSKLVKKIADFEN